MLNKTDNLIYDWNKKESTPKFPPVQFDDETLRDGLQAPNVLTPAIDDKLKIIHHISSLNIHCADIGLPAAGEKHKQDAITLAKEITEQKLNIIPDCASRTVIKDVDAVLDVANGAGCKIEISLFIGSSPIRQFAEGWTLNDMLDKTEAAVRYAVKNGLDVMFVTEDTTRANPDTIEALYKCAIENGASRICVCDTCGHADPEGISALMSFIVKLVKKTGVKDIEIDWHGHNDRGLAVINSIVAYKSGANRIHATALGIGERAGNTSMELLLANLYLSGIIPGPLTEIPKYCNTVSNACGIQIPKNYPIVGKGAFETATGVHAAAIIKALKKGDRFLADRVYSGVPAGDFGLEQHITIGPMSGKSNVIFWLNKNKINFDDSLVEYILSYAKKSKSILSNKEVLNLCSKHKNK